MVALANGIGPIVGGALASASIDSWRWIFRMNLRLTAITTLCAIYLMPLKKVEGDWKKCTVLINTTKQQRLTAHRKVKATDFLGAVLALAGTVLLVAGLEWAGTEYPWDSPAVLGTLIVGAAVCVAFVLWQWKGPIFALVPRK